MRALRHALIRGLQFKTQADFDAAMAKLAKLDRASGGFVEFDLALDGHDYQVMIVSQTVFESLSAALDMMGVYFTPMSYSNIRLLGPNIYHRHRRLVVKTAVPRKM